VDEHLYDPKWKEVFLLTAGLLDSADELLLMMRRKSEQVLKVPEINALMAAAQLALLPSKKNDPEVIRRCFALALALARARALALAVAVDHAVARAVDRARDLDRALARALEFDRDRDRVLDRYLDLYLDLDRDLNLDLGLLKGYSQTNNLNEQIFSEINNYLSANLLIINCISSANLVSKPIREKMLHEMFLAQPAARDYQIPPILA